jgi:hypothetical protein
MMLFAALDDGERPEDRDAFRVATGVVVVYPGSPWETKQKELFGDVVVLSHDNRALNSRPILTLPSLTSVPVTSSQPIMVLSVCTHHGTHSPLASAIRERLLTVAPFWALYLDSLASHRRNAPLQVEADIETALTTPGTMLSRCVAEVCTVEP